VHAEAICTSVGRRCSYILLWFAERDRGRDSRGSAGSSLDALMNALRRFSIEERRIETLQRRVVTAEAQERQPADEAGDGRSQQ